MRSFNVKNLKQYYVHGEIEPFCEIAEIDVEEFEQAKEHEDYYLTEEQIKKLKEQGIFKEWV